ncbi:MAG: galactosyldiacylglycerol synthase [Firmicutes bacterium HGW-Firmicutes-1]|jgi:processive 1,2-diacylglycerol beta-glucosyltransferase|nr:MAG: galactosyldiacylglycerol synthase [Firmicutes bacterium HGW-Firmicutes-1]
MKSKVIIFTASTGHGHNQVALAMKNELVAQGCEVSIYEPFKEVSKSLDILLSDGYRVLATKMPKFYGRIYKMSNQQFLGKPVEIFSVKVIEDKLEEIVDHVQPDLIISTHPLIVKAMCSLKRKSKYLGPFVSVITDYMPHKCYISPIVDAYIVGSQYTKLKVIEKGISENRVFVYGIPIHRSFRECDNKMEKSNQFTVLLMGGSMGLSGIKKVFKELLNIHAPIKIIVVCGNNMTLKKYLEERYLSQVSNKDITILGFTNEISQYMEVSDVIVTKPGGLTVTEAFAKNIPIIIPFYIPGQEEENAEMLIDMGVAVKVGGPKELGTLIESFIQEPNLLNHLKRNMYKVSIDHSLDDAINLCIKFIESQNDDIGIKYAK